MRLRFLGPCECGVYVPPDAVVGGDGRYLQAWQDFAEGRGSRSFERFETDSSSFAHSAGATARRPIRYESTTADTPFLPPHVFSARVRLEPGLVRELLRLAAERMAERSDLPPSALQAGSPLDIRSMQVRLYYGGIMVVWFDSLDGTVPRATRDLEILERCGIALLQVLAEWVDGELVRAFAGHPGSVSASPGRLFRWRGTRPPPQWEPMPRGPAFWVTRSLIVERAETGGTERIREWLEPVTSSSLDPVLPKEGFRMEWMRYAFDLAAMNGTSPTFDDAFESMLFCQFYWATLERIEFQMFRVLGRIDSSTDTGAVRASYVALGTLREAAELTLAHHRHQTRYLTRVRHRLVEQILKGWQFSDLVANLREVIEIARVRHEQLLQRAAARGNLVTDLLLFAIGSVAVLDFFLGLTVVGRQLASDSSIGRRDEGWFGLVDLVSGWRVNDVLSIATLFVIVALLLIARHRSRRPF